MRNIYPGPFIAIALLGASLGLSASVVAEELTEETGQAVLSELKKVRKLLEQHKTRPSQPSQLAALRRNTPDRQLSVSIAGSPAIGRADAPVTLVEFTDYQCYFCSRFHTDSFEALKKNYVDKGLLRFVSRDLPLSFHSEAAKAAEAARCAGDQGAFWEMRDLLLSNPKALSETHLLAYAGELSLDAKRFRTCLEEGTYAADVQRDFDDAMKAGLSGTPSFVLGTVSGDRVEGTAIIGAQPYAVFDARIKQLLSQGGSQDEGP